MIIKSNKSLKCIIGKSASIEERVCVFTKIYFEKFCMQNVPITKIMSENTFSQ